VKRRTFLLSVAVVLLALIPVHAADDGRHGEWSNVYVFGDSVSDNGNFVKIIGPIEQGQPYHYWQGRYSNGPVWVEHLARQLHANLLDFAVGTATTGETTHGSFYPYVPTVLDQIRSFRASRVNIPTGSLFIVQGGANDLFQVLFTGGDPQDVPRSAVTNIMAGIALLEKAGAKHILVGNLLDLGTLPVFRYYGVPASYMSMLTAAYNRALENAVRDFAAENRHITISVLDIYSCTAAIMAKPEDYGLGNVTDVSPNATVPNQFASDYFFWDWVHPTTTTHQAWAEFAVKAVEKLERRGEEQR
jgi:phospholipase/lecithinase/hemolysin